MTAGQEGIAYGVPELALSRQSGKWATSTQQVGPHIRRGVPRTWWVCSAPTGARRARDSIRKRSSLDANYDSHARPSAMVDFPPRPSSKKGLFSPFVVIRARAGAVAPVVQACLAFGGEACTKKNYCRGTRTLQS